MSLDQRPDVALTEARFVPDPRWPLQLALAISVGGNVSQFGILLLYLAWSL